VLLSTRCAGSTIVGVTCVLLNRPVGFLLVPLCEVGSQHSAKGAMTFASGDIEKAMLPGLHFASDPLPRLNPVVFRTILLDDRAILPALYRRSQGERAKTDSST